MGFWSTFGKIAQPIVSVGASLIPGGSAAMGLLGNIGKVGQAVSPVLGGLAAGRAQGQQQDYTNAAGQGQQMNSALLQEMQAQIAAANQNQGMQGRLAGDTVRGDAMANMQDVHIPDNDRVKVAHFSGGMRPSNMGPNSRAAGGMLSSGALSHMGEPGIQAPELTDNVAELPHSGLLDKILGAATPALAGAGALFGQGGPMQPGAPQPDPLKNKLQGMEDLLMDPMRGIEGLNTRNNVY